MKKNRSVILFVVVPVFCLVGCNSISKKDDDDFLRDDRSFGERVSDWWKRSGEREDEKFDRMFESATRKS